MAVKRIVPKEALDLLSQGYSYVDVRSIPEFESGHPAGAFNVPLMHFMPGRGMTPNADFAAVMQKRWPKESLLIIGCKTSGRSLRAAELLAGLGYTGVMDMRGGFEGERDASGAMVVPGWKEAGLPVETTSPAEKTWEGLK